MPSKPSRLPEILKAAGVESQLELYQEGVW